MVADRMRHAHDAGEQSWRDLDHALVVSTVARASTATQRCPLLPLPCWPSPATPVAVATQCGVTTGARRLWQYQTSIHPAVPRWRAIDCWKVLRRTFLHPTHHQDDGSCLGPRLATMAPTPATGRPQAGPRAAGTDGFVRRRSLGRTAVWWLVVQPPPRGAHHCMWRATPRCGAPPW